MLHTQSWLKLAVLLLFVCAGTALALSDSSTAAAIAPGVQAPDDHFVGAAKCAECHSDKFEQFSATPHHALVTDPHTKISDKGCEACHGPGAAHVAAGGDAAKIFNPRKATAEEVAETCTRCHLEQSLKRQPYHVEHDPKTVSCNDCHSAHQEKTNPWLLVDNPPGLCMQCHNEVASDFRKPYHHRVFEGGISCLDCHSAHGRRNTAESRHSAEGMSALCARCHADKHGPFVFEHLALTRSEEGCLACHNPHGSVNNRLLVRGNVFQLCIQCHSEIGLSADPELGVFPHDLSSPRTQNCTVCHTQIHGSNTSRVFLN